MHTEGLNKVSMVVVIVSPFNLSLSSLDLTRFNVPFAYIHTNLNHIDFNDDKCIL